MIFKQEINIFWSKKLLLQNHIELEYSPEKGDFIAFQTSTIQENAFKWRIFSQPGKIGTGRNTKSLSVSTP